MYKNKPFISKKRRKQQSIRYINAQAIPPTKTKRLQKKCTKKTKNSTSYDLRGKQKSIPLHILKFTKKIGNCTEKVG